jgi:hypothetical protein
MNLDADKRKFWSCSRSPELLRLFARLLRRFAFDRFRRDRLVHFRYKPLPCGVVVWLVTFDHVAARLRTLQVCHRGPDPEIGLDRHCRHISKSIREDPKHTSLCICTEPEAVVVGFEFRRTPTPKRRLSHLGNSYDPTETNSPGRLAPSWHAQNIRAHLPNAFFPDLALELDES